MKKLEHNQLLEYLKHAIKLESSLIAQEQIKDTYTSSSNARKPVLSLEKHPAAPKLKTVNVDKTYGNTVTLGYLIGGFNLLLMIVALFEYGITFLVNSTGALFIWIPLVIGACMVFIPKQKAAKGDREYKEQYDSELAVYNDKCRAIDSKNEDIRKQYNIHYGNWQSSNNVVYRFIDTKRKETNDTLERLYAKDVIFSKYRNLPALTSIYEYILSGRCDELTGPNGAYNLYEDELRKNVVISQLNTIIANLESIRNNQYMLYEELKEVQKNTKTIANELYAIKGYTANLNMLTALNTYYNGITAGNSHIMTYWR